MIIYKTINLINGKFYIGKDSKNNAKYYGSGILLNKAIKKYGKDNFRKEIIEDDILAIEVLNEREKYWIKKLNAKNPNGYNLSDGGDGFVKGYIMSKETKNKIKKSLIGHTVSKETKDKIRKSLIGHTVSTETKNKLKKSKLVSIPWNKGKTGIYSKETLEKMKPLQLVK